MLLNLRIVKIVSFVNPAIESTFVHPVYIELTLAGYIEHTVNIQYSLAAIQL